MRCGCEAARVSGPPQPFVLPAHYHVRFDDLARPLQVGAGFVHVQPNRVNLVSGGLGQAIAGRVAQVGV